MSTPERQQVEPVDRLIGGYLDREAERTDAGPLLDRIRTSRTESPDRRQERGWTAPSRSHPRRPLALSFTWSGLTALAILVAFLGGRQFGPLAASASSLLRDLQATHSGEIDLCYSVQYAPDPRTWDGKNRLEGPSRSVMWTRGERFWSDCDLGEINLQIGREEDGTLWVSPSPKKGIRFSNDPSRLPAEVSMICAINTMSVPRLVEDVLAGFDLRRETAGGDSGRSRTLVWATLRPGHSHPLLSDALLEIDPRNNTLVRLVLWTVRDGQPTGTVTYTLLESSARNEDQYRMTSHLDDGAEIEVHIMKEDGV